MSLKLIAPPQNEPLTLDEVKAHLRVTSDDEDDLIRGLMTAARLHVEGKDGILGCALVTQTWDYFMDSFGCHDEDEIEIPLGPLQSVSAITYIDTNGTEQTLAQNQYEVFSSNMPGVIAPAYGKIWPDTRDKKNAVKIRFVCGFGAAKDVPQPIKQSLLLTIGHFYQNREAFVSGGMSDLPMGVYHLLMPYRRVGF
jgi:uncharacterized phiE125 gp8 family phage protein